MVNTLQPGNEKNEVANEIYDVIQGIEKDLERFYDENEEIFEKKNINLDKFTIKNVPVNFLNKDSFKQLSYDEKYLVVFLYNKFREDKLLESILKIDTKLVLDAVNFAYTNKVKVIQNIDKIIEELYNYDVNSDFYKELIEGVKTYLLDKNQEVYDKIKEKEREIMQLKKEQELLEAFEKVLNPNKNQG